MKPKLLLILAAALAVAAADPFGQTGTPKTLTAILGWAVTTNWTPAGQSRTLLGWNGEGEDPNITTYYERGTVSSNLIAILRWKDQVHSLVLESVPFAITNRSYTLKTDRVYR